MSDDLQIRLYKSLTRLVEHWWATGEVTKELYVYNTLEADLLKEMFINYLWSHEGCMRLGELFQGMAIPTAAEVSDYPASVILRTSIAGYESAKERDTLNWKGNRLKIKRGMAYHYTIILETGGAVSADELKFLTLQGIEQREHFGFGMFWKDIDRNQAIWDATKVFDEDGNVCGRAPMPEYALLYEEQRDLAHAFIKQLVDEVERDGRSPFTGQFILHNPSEELLRDHQIEQIRICIKSTGVWISVVNNLKDGNYAWGWWSPNWDNLVVDFGHKGSWMLRMICAAIWRDACVVRRKAFMVRECGGKHAVRAHGAKLNPTVLPRTIYVGQWGSDEDKATIEHIQRRAHAVRAHYRHSESCTDRARELAAEYAYPEPPAGYTFVSPYMRGEGEVSDTPLRPVVCRGLLTASVALNRFSVG